MRSLAFVFWNREGFEMIGIVLWKCDKEKNGIIKSGGNEYYFDISTSRYCFDKLQRNDFVIFGEKILNDGCRTAIFIKKMHYGYIQFFDGEEGYVFCPLLNQSFYVHHSALEGKESEFVKFRPVYFSLYENLYMKQVDNIFPFYHGEASCDELAINFMMNELFELGSDAGFEIAARFYA